MTLNRVIDVGGVKLDALLDVPSSARAVVVFAHGSGSNRTSPRDAFVAAALRRTGFATLLSDLLTPAEAAADDVTYELRFDIPFLSARLAAVVDWVLTRPEVRGMSVGLFGASTGAAVALQVAAAAPSRIAAVVSRGGRPDLVEGALASVRAPTLLIVGANDSEVLHLNERAHASLRCKKRLAIIAGATHLFEEPGALDQVAALSSRWFALHVPARTPAAGARDEKDEKNVGGAR